MAGYVDEKVAKVTLDNKGFSKNADEAIAAINRLKEAFAKVNGKDATNNIASDMSTMNDTISKSTQKSEGLLSRLKGIFSRSTQDIDMSGGGRSIDRMNTDIASKTANTSSILSRLKGIFQKADNHEGFPNSIKSIDGLNSKIGGFDASPLANAFSKAASSVQNSLSVMDIAVGNVLGNMLQKAMSFTGQFFRGYGDGLAEYKNKLGSIQTIMTNTEWEIPDSSTRMRRVSGALEQLNDYADKTIYSFADMTKNIGTFTAAGVSLDKSATAIKGISNLAAASGSSTEQASTAMYQLSQALAAGRVGLQDWNSVVNAGMGGKLFQDRLTQMAEKMGHARDMSKSFRDSLKDGWLTSEVLLETLREFSEDQSMLDAATKVKSFGQLVDTVQEAIGSGWAQTWEYFLGGFEEAKEMWTSIGDIVNPFINDDQGKYWDEVLGIERSLGNYRNAMLKTWKDLGGQQSLFNSIKNSFEIVFKAMTKFREGFRSVIGDYKQSAKTFYTFTKALESITEGIKKNELFFNTLNSIGKTVGQTFVTLGWALKTVFSGIKAVGDASGSILLPIRTAADSIARFMESLRSNTNAHVVFYHLGKTLANVFNIIVTLGRIAIFIIKDILRGFSKFGDSKGLVTFATTLSDVTGKVLTFVRAIEKFVLSSNKFEQIGNVIGKVSSNIGSAFSAVFSKLKTLANPFGNAEVIFSGAANIFAKAGEKLSSALNKIGEVTSQAWTAIVDSFKSGYEGLKDAYTSFNIGSIIKAIIGLFAFDKWLKFKNSKGSVIDMIIEKFKDMFSGAKESGTNIIDEVKGVFTSLQGTINSFTQSIKIGSLLMIAIALGILALSIDRLSKIEMKDLSKGMLGLGSALGILLKLIKVMSVTEIPKGSAMQLIGIAFAIRILASAMVKMAEIPTDKLMEAIGGTYAAIYGLVRALKYIDKLEGSEAKIMQLIGIAFAVRILVWSIKAIAKLEPEKLVYALPAVGTLIFSLAKVTKYLDKVHITKSAIANLITFAISIRILVWSVKSLAKIEWPQLLAAVGSVITLMAAMAIASRVMSKVHVAKSALANLIVFSIAIRILTSSVIKIAALSWDSILAATSSVVTLLESLAIASRIMTKVKIDKSAMAGMIAFGISIWLLSQSVIDLGTMEWDMLLLGMAGVEALLLSLVGVSHLMKKAKVNMASAMVLVAFGLAIYAITKAIEPLTQLSIEQLVKSIASVEVMLFSLVGVAALMKKVKFNAGAALSMIILTAMMTSVADNLMKVADKPWTSLLAASAGISAVFIAMAYTAKIINGSVKNFAEVGQLRVLFDSFASVLLAIGTSMDQIGKLDWRQMLVGLGGIVLVLGALTTMTAIIDHIQPDVTTLGGIAVFAPVLYAVGSALSNVAAQPWTGILAATGAIIATLGAMVAAMAIIDKVGSTSGVLQLMGMAVALNMLAIPIMLLSTLNLVAVGVALLALAGNLAILLAAGALAQVVAPGLMILSQTLITFGISSILAASSVLIAGLGFLAFVTAIKELAAIAPEAFKTVAEGMVSFSKAIAESAPILIQAWVSVVKESINGLVVLIPFIVDAAFKLVIGLVNGIKENAPELVKASVEMLVELAKGLIENIDILVQTAIELAVKFIESLANALIGVRDRLIPALQNLFMAISDVLLSVLGGLLAPLLEKIVEILTPVGTMITEFLSNLASAIEPIFTPLMEGLKVLFESIATIITVVAEAIIATVNSIKDIIRSIADVIISTHATIQTIVNAIVEVFRIMADAIDTVITGVINIIDGVANVIKTAGEAISGVLTSVGEVFKSFGEGVKTALEGVGKVVESFGTGIKTALEGVGKIFESIGTGIKTALDGVADIIKAVGDAAKSFGEGFKAFGEGVKLVGEHGANAATGLASLTVEVAKLGASAYAGNLQGFTTDIENLAKACSTLGDTASNILTLSTSLTIISSSLTIISGVGSLAATAFQTLSTEFTNISTSAESASTAFQNLSGPVNTLIGMMSAILSSFGTAIGQFQTMVGAMEAVNLGFINIQNSITFLMENFNLINTSVETFKTSLLNAQTQMGEFFSSISNSTESFAILTAATETGMQGMVMAVQNGMANVQTTMDSSIGALASAVGAGFGLVSSAVSSSMETVIGAVQTSMTGVVNSISTSMSSVADQANASFSAISTSISGSISQISRDMSQGMSGVSQTISSRVTEINSQFTKMSSTVSQIISSMMTVISSSIQNGMGIAANNVYSGMSQIISTVGSYTGSARSSGYNVGYYISSGIAAGMYANMWEIESAANRIIYKAREAARAAADIHSPSRLFAKDVGKFIPQGVAMGIANEMPSTIKQMTKTFKSGFSKAADGAVSQGQIFAEAVSSAVNSVGDMLDVAIDDMSYSPKITPIVDTSKLDKFKLKDYDVNIGGLNKALPTPLYSGVPNSSQQTTINNDNSNKEFNVNVKVDTNGKPVDARELAVEVQRHLKDFDDQNRRSKGEEVFW